MVFNFFFNWSRRSFHILFSRLCMTVAIYGGKKPTHNHILLNSIRFINYFNFSKSKNFN